MNVLLLYPRFQHESFQTPTRSARDLMGRRAIMPPLGLVTLASYLPADFSLRLVDRNCRAETEEEWEWADVVFLSVMLIQENDYRECVRLAKAHRKPIAVGGPFTHSKREVVIDDGDWVCFGEVESIVEQFVADLRADRRGRVYEGGSKSDLSKSAVPRFDLLGRLNDYTTMAIQFSRGCPFDCEFCDIIEIYGRVPRTKPPAQVLAELTSLKSLGFKGYVAFVDDNFIGNRRLAKAMLRELAVWNRANDYPFKFYTQVTINVADDRELLTGLEEANFLGIFVGIETPDPELLRTTQKPQNIPGDMIAKARTIREHGLHLTAGFVIGFDGEDRSVFETQKAFVAASGIALATLSILHALPNTQLSRRLEREGRLRDRVAGPVAGPMHSMNFLPKGRMTKREYLGHFAELATQLYQPKAYFARVRISLLQMRFHVPARIAFLQYLMHLPLVLRTIFYLGIRENGARRMFWRTLITVIRHNPRALEGFTVDCYNFYYVRKYVPSLVDALHRYVADPPPDAVLDVHVSPDRERRLPGVPA